MWFEAHITDSVSSVLSIDLKMRLLYLAALLTGSSFVTTANAGPIGYGICQAGCAGVVTACYAAAGAVFVRWNRLSSSQE